jgi:hypothetical protein
MSTSWLLALLLTAAVAFLLGASFLKMELDRLAQLAKWSGRYTNSMRAFISASDTLPKSIIDDLQFWNKAIADKRMPFWLGIATSMRKNKILRGPQTTRNHDDDEKRLFFQKYPELEEGYINTVFDAVMTISYSHWLWGWGYDRLWLICSLNTSEGVWRSSHWRFKTKSSLLNVGAGQ